MELRFNLTTSKGFFFLFGCFFDRQVIAPPMSYSSSPCLLRQDLLPYVVQACLKLAVKPRLASTSRASRCWDYGCEPSCLADLLFKHLINFTCGIHHHIALICTPVVLDYIFRLSVRYKEFPHTLGYFTQPGLFLSHCSLLKGSTF